MKNTITILSIVKKQDESTAREKFINVISKFMDAEISDVLKIGQPNQIPNQLLFALEVERVIAVDVIKSLTFEGITILKNDPAIGAAVTEAKHEMENQQANTIQRIKKDDSVKKKLFKKGDYSVEELAAIGDWKLMVDVALNQSYKDIEKSRQIKQLLPDVLNRAIEKEIERGGKSLGFAKNSVEKLVAIAENETLKRFQLLNSIKKAGEAIIDLCSQHPRDLLGDLIFLANSTSTISQINIKAFLTFYKFVKEDPEAYDYEVLVATRHLNTRAMDAIHLSSVKLTPEDKKLFDSGIEFFKEKRKNL